MGYYSKKTYFGFGKNSCVGPTGKGKKKPKPKKKGHIVILGVVAPCPKDCKRRVDPSMN